MSVQHRTPVPCPQCFGRGTYAYWGTGMAYDGLGGIYRESAPVEDECRRCDGAGKVWKPVAVAAAV